MLKNSQLMVSLGPLYIKVYEYSFFCVVLLKVFVMERKQFLRTLGSGAAFALVFPCVGGCSKDKADGDIKEEPSGVDFTIDLDSEEGAKLKNNGDFMIKFGFSKKMGVYLNVLCIIHASPKMVLR